MSKTVISLILLCMPAWFTRVLLVYCRFPLASCLLFCCRCSSRSYWLSRFQSLLYCSENNQLGEFSEELRSCSCQFEHNPCQLPPPCSVGEGPGCAACAPDNQTRCGSCNPGFALTQGICRPMVADSTENYLGLETDLQDLELGYLLQRADRRLEVLLSPANQGVACWNKNKLCTCVCVCVVGACHLHQQRHATQQLVRPVLEEEDAADAEKQQVQVQHGPHAAGNLASDLPYQEQHPGASTHPLHQSVRREPLGELVHPHQREQLPQLESHQAGPPLRMLQLDADARQQVEDLLWDHSHLPSE